MNVRGRASGASASPPSDGGGCTHSSASTSASHRRRASSVATRCSTNCRISLVQRKRWPPGQCTTRWQLNFASVLESRSTTSARCTVTPYSSCSHDRHDQTTRPRQARSDDATTTGTIRRRDHDRHDQTTRPRQARSDDATTTDTIRRRGHDRHDQTTRPRQARSDDHDRRRGGGTRATCTPEGAQRRSGSTDQRPHHHRAQGSMLG
jgi:hypothetical protein